MDSDELAVLASQVEMRNFTARQRIYKMGAPADRAYVMVSGGVSVTTVDDDNQEVIVDEPGPGEFFGFASMLEQTKHQTEATATKDTVCIEVDRSDILVLIQRKPHAAMDMLAVLGRQFHAAQQLIRIRALRHPNEVIEEQETLGERVADSVASFGGSWVFIIIFGMFMIVYTMINISLQEQGVGPVSVYPAQPVPVHAGGHSGAGDHDEPEPAGQEGPFAQRTGFRCQSAGAYGDPGTGA